MKTQFASTWLALTCLTATGHEPDPAKIIADSPPADVVPFACDPVAVGTLAPINDSAALRVSRSVQGLFIAGDDFPARAWQSAAEQGSAKGEDHAGATADPGLLEEGRVLDLEASLRRAQGRFAETLKLHDRALAVTRPERSAVSRLTSQLLSWTAM